MKIDGWNWIALILYHIACFYLISYTLLKKRMLCLEGCTSQNLWIFFSIYVIISLIKRLKRDENTYKLPLAVRQNGSSLSTLPWLMYCIKISNSQNAYSQFIICSNTILTHCAGCEWAECQNALFLPCGYCFPLRF